MEVFLLITSVGFLTGFLTGIYEVHKSTSISLILWGKSITNKPLQYLICGTMCGLLFAGISIFLTLPLYIM